MEFDEFLNKNPLLRFSIYTHIQARTVMELGLSIKDKFDMMFLDDGTIDMRFGDPYGKIWLWVIGAYEVVRTMSDEKWKNSWSPNKREDILAYKKRIAALRIPFAKQELRNGRPIGNENSYVGTNHGNKSFIFRVSDNMFNIRDEIDAFDHLIKGIQHSDILRDLRDNFS